MVQIKLLCRDPISRPDLIVRKSLFMVPDLLWSLTTSYALLCVLTSPRFQSVQRDPQRTGQNVFVKVESLPFYRH